jgi:hypothetical protein
MKFKDSYKIRKFASLLGYVIRFMKAQSFRSALSNAAPAIYFSSALRKHIIWADY